MYDSHNIATKIKEIAKSKNILIKRMLSDCSLGSNTMSAMYHGKSIASDSLACIADYLECSIDELMGRTQYIKKSPPAEEAEDEGARQLMEYYYNMNMDGRRALLAAAFGFASMGEYKKYGDFPQENIMA